MSNLIANNINGLAANSFANLLHVQDRKPAGTIGDSLGTGMNTRTINSIHYNGIAGASLSSNVVNLPAGNYFVQGFCVGDVMDQSKAILYNQTDSTELLIGQSLQSYDSGGGSSNYSVMGMITLAAAKDIIVRFHAGNAGYAGYSTSAGTDEIYLDLMFWKIA
ncbi:hypothetical protein RYZ26_19410 [Terasakiella sp. A23]|uniref:hypothetical protein n=1 Tax=Terasakiella sp. FCG-A23 TaxID=3080561 RepID=UPI002953C439|nr:hypothetical protein [Terasakiella sp. A23]MDV7341778.1 hypothetical protein [Terasakiella sp. A23]